MSAESGVLVTRDRKTEFGRGLGSRRNGPDAGVLAVEQLEPLRERPRGERRLELRGEIILSVGELPLGEVGPADQLTGPREELRLERAERQVASVGCRVDPVARKRAGQRPRARLLAEPVADQLVAPMRHRDAHASAPTRAGAADERREHLRHRTEPAGREVRDLHRRPGRRVLEHAGPAEVVEIVTCALGVASLRAEARHRAVHEGGGEIVRADPEPSGNARPEPFEHDVGAGADVTRKRHLRLQVADDRLLAGPKGLIPSRCGRPQRIAARRLDPDDAGAEPHELAAGERDREVPGELHDQDALERLRVGLHDTYSDRVLTDRSIARERPGRDRQAGSEEKRRLILDAAVRVFARDGYHTSRVGDIAEEAGVAHGLLYHYFSSKEEVLATLFRENWGELLGRLARVEQSDEPADEQLRGIAKILLRTWRNDPDLVRVMVREVARSSHLQEQVDEIRAGFATIQRVIERGQSEGVFRADLDPRLASWIFYGGLEEILTGWVLGQLPDGDEEVARAERTIIDVVCGGLTVRDGA